jgi:hypothetical protein
MEFTVRGAQVHLNICGSSMLLASELTNMIEKKPDACCNKELKYA